MTGPVCGFDLETTGISPWDDVPVSGAFVTGRLGALVTRSSLINPGRPIPPETTAIHGITDAMVTSAMNLDDACEQMAGIIVAASREGVSLVGCNLAFDLSMLDSCLLRSGSPGLAERGWSGPVADVRVIDLHVDKWRKGKRRLVNLCEHYGVDTGASHTAGADAAAAVKVFAAQCERYPFLARMRPGTRHTAQGRWHEKWWDSFDEYRVERDDEPLDPRTRSWPIYSDNATYVQLTLEEVSA